MGNLQACDRAIDVNMFQAAPNTEATVGSMVLVMSVAWGPMRME